MFGGIGIDRFGAKWILAIGMFITSGNLLLYTIVDTPTQFVLVRLIHGLGSGLLAPSAFALMALAAKEGKYGRTMAHTGAIVGFAAIIGPAFGGIISSRFSYDTVFYSISVLMFFSAFLVLFFVPSPKKEIKSKKDGALKGEFKSLLKSVPLTNVYWGSFSLFFSLGVVTTLLPVRAEELSTNAALGGIMISTFGVVAILVFLLPTNRIYDHFDQQKVLFVGMATVSTSLILLAFLNSIIPVFISMAIFGLGFALMFPAMTTTILKLVSKSTRGKAFGMFYACFSIGVVVGSFSMGLIKATPTIGFFISSVLVLLMALFVLYRYRKTLVIIDTEI